MESDLDVKTEIDVKNEPLDSCHDKYDFKDDLIMQQEEKTCGIQVDVSDTFEPCCVFVEIKEEVTEVKKEGWDKVKIEDIGNENSEHDNYGINYEDTDASDRQSSERQDKAKLQSRDDYPSECTLKSSQILFNSKVYTTENSFKYNEGNSNSMSEVDLRTEIKSDPLSEKRFNCNYCNYRTSHKRNLRKHIEIHSGKRPHKCVHCDYAALRRETLESHMRVHTGDKPYSCTLCDYTAAHKLTLQIHLRNHSGEKPHKCTYCNYAASHKSSLRKHVKIHSIEKPYKCDLCDYSTTENSYLMLHLRIHSDKKPFKCGHCVYTSSRKTDFQRHIKIHSGEKPHKCNHCDYAATQKSTLQIHIRNHTGDKPFRCSHCKYTTSKNSNLQRHIKVHSGCKVKK